jgi:hypothetical protein
MEDFTINAGDRVDPLTKQTPFQDGVETLSDKISDA